LRGKTERKRFTSTGAYSKSRLLKKAKSVITEASSNRRIVDTTRRKRPGPRVGGGMTWRPENFSCESGRRVGPACREITGSAVRKRFDTETAIRPV
jgi:hypothetical protein